MRTLTYSIVIHPNEADDVPGYWVEVPALPGCFTQGRTVEEAGAMAEDAIRCYLEAVLRRGGAVPDEEPPLAEPVLSRVRVHVPLPA